MNGLNSSVKQHTMAEWIKQISKIHLYATYKRLTLDVKTVHRYKVKRIKIYLMHVEGRKKLS